MIRDAESNLLLVKSIILLVYIANTSQTRDHRSHTLHAEVWLCETIRYCSQIKVGVVFFHVAGAVSWVEHGRLVSDKLCFAGFVNAVNVVKTAEP